MVTGWFCGSLNSILANDVNALRNRALSGKFRHRVEGGKAGAFEPRAVDFAEHLNNGAHAVLRSVASPTRVELKVVSQVIEAMAAGFGDNPSAKEHGAEATLADGGNAQASPFWQEATIPIVG